MLQINARGVVLASGGYADNPDMINEYTMHDYDALTVMGSSGRTGNAMGLQDEVFNIIDGASHTTWPTARGRFWGKAHGL